MATVETGDSVKTNSQRNEAERNNYEQPYTGTRSVCLLTDDSDNL